MWVKIRVNNCIVQLCRVPIHNSSCIKNATCEAHMCIMKPIYLYPIQISIFFEFQFCFLFSAFLSLNGSIFNFFTYPILFVFGGTSKSVPAPPGTCPAQKYQKIWTCSISMIFFRRDSPPAQKKVVPKKKIHYTLLLYLAPPSLLLHIIPRSHGLYSAGTSPPLSPHDRPNFFSPSSSSPQATADDIVAMQTTNLMCLPENYQVATNHCHALNFSI